MRIGDSPFSPIICCKILFPNYAIYDYFVEKGLIKNVLLENGFLESKKECVDISIVRKIPVEGDWASAYKKYGPEYGDWSSLSVVDKMKFISKFYNQHPYRTQITDPIYPCCVNLDTFFLPNDKWIKQWTSEVIDSRFMV